MGSKIISVDLEAQETNILLINLDLSVVTAEEFCRRLLIVGFIFVFYAKWRFSG